MTEYTNHDLDSWDHRQRWVDQRFHGDRTVVVQHSELQTRDLVWSTVRQWMSRSTNIWLMYVVRFLFNYDQRAVHGTCYKKVTYKDKIYSGLLQYGYTNVLLISTIDFSTFQLFSSLLNYCVNNLRIFSKASVGPDYQRFWLAPLTEYAMAWLTGSKDIRPTRTGSMFANFLLCYNCM